MKTTVDEAQILGTVNINIEEERGIRSPGTEEKGLRDGR